MIAQLFAQAKSWLGRRHDPAADEARFCEAYRRYQDAKARNDTRAQHDAWGPLRDAQTARLNRALGWRGTR